MGKGQYPFCCTPNELMKQERRTHAVPFPPARPYFVSGSLSHPEPAAFTEYRESVSFEVKSDGMS